MFFMAWDGAERRAAHDLDVQPDGKYHPAIGFYFDTSEVKLQDIVEGTGGRLGYNLTDGRDGLVRHGTVFALERRKIQVQV